MDTKIQVLLIQVAIALIFCGSTRATANQDDSEAQQDNPEDLAPPLNSLPSSDVMNGLRRSRSTVPKTRNSADELATGNQRVFPVENRRKSLRKGAPAGSAYPDVLIKLLKTLSDIKKYNSTGNRRKTAWKSRNSAGAKRRKAVFGSEKSHSVEKRKKAVGKRPVMAAARPSIFNKNPKAVLNKKTPGKRSLTYYKGYARVPAPPPGIFNPDW